MTDALQRGPVAALQRGSVVVRRGQYGVVWLIDGGDLVLHPISKPSRRTKVHDVELTFAETLAAGILLPRAIVRCGQPVRATAVGHNQVGDLSGAACCRITLAVARSYADAEAAARWESDRRHQREARSNSPVRGA